MITLNAACDRCGSAYKPYFPKMNGDEVKFNGIMLVNFDPDHNYRRRGNVDLCPGCAYQLSVWLEGPKVQSEMVQVIPLGEKDDESAV